MEQTKNEQVMTPQALEEMLKASNMEEEQKELTLKVYSEASQQERIFLQKYPLASILVGHTIYLESLTRQPISREKVEAQLKAIHGPHVHLVRNS